VKKISHNQFSKNFKIYIGKISLIKFILETEMEKKIAIFLIVTILTIILIMVYTYQNIGKGEEKKENQIGGISLTSPAFEHGGNIPIKYTCDGDDISPPLSFSNLPNGTKSLVIILDDPDASGGIWAHWIVFNIPADITGFKEDVGPRYYMGKNSWGNNDYSGPCPPIGEEHRCYFRLYALDTDLNLFDGASRQEIDDAMTGHILGQTSLMGKYSV
jgi:Raf kinase inhibitor-like YbhB/YbcL family protein